MLFRSLEVRADESWCAFGNGAQVYVVLEWFLAGVNAKDFFSTFDVGCVDGDLTVESSWAQEGWVENVWSVGGGDDDDVVFGFKAVHFDQELVEGLFAFVVATTEPRSAFATYGVNFVNEDDAGCGFFGLFEEVADSGGSDSDEHFDEI